MIDKNLLKDVLVENEKNIREVGQIIKRPGRPLPKQLNKPIVLYGVRRSGKTYCLYEIFKRFTGAALYIDFEDERFSGFQLSDFQTLLDAFWELNPQAIDKEAVFLLDEIQNIKGWEKFVRRITEKEGIRVYVSGSSSKMMPQELHTALRGRSWGEEIFPFSFSEYLTGRGIDFSNKNLYGKNKVKIKNFFLAYLRWGGFPEVAFLNKNSERRKIIKEYIEAIFFKDLVERYKISNIPLLSALQEKLFTSFSTKFSLNAVNNQLKSNLPFSKDTLYAYYRHFLDSMIVFEVKKFTESFYKRLRNPAKIYLVDPALGRDVASNNLGRRMENLVFLELIRKKNEVFYFENNNECDFVARNEAGQLSLIQATWQLRAENKEREYEGIFEASRLVKTKSAKIITAEDEGTTTYKGIRINILPAWKWLLGQQ